MWVFWGLMFILSSAAGSLHGALLIRHGPCSWCPCPCVSPLTLKKTDLRKPPGCYRHNWVWLPIEDLAASVLFSFGSLILEEASFHAVRTLKQFQGEIGARGKTTCQQQGLSYQASMLSRLVVSNSLRPHGQRSPGFSGQEYWSGLPFPTPHQAWEWTN